MYCYSIVNNIIIGSLKRAPASGMESCNICGKEMKKNMIKRHLAKHKKEGKDFFKLRVTLILMDSYLFSIK